MAVFDPAVGHLTLMIDESIDKLDKHAHVFGGFFWQNIVNKVIDTIAFVYQYFDIKEDRRMS